MNGAPHKAACYSAECSAINESFVHAHSEPEEFQCNGYSPSPVRCFLQDAGRVGSVVVLTTVLSMQAGQMTDGNASLQGRVAEAENIRVAVQEQVQDFQQKLQLTISDNVVLRRQLDFLQKQVGVRMPS